MRFSRLVPVALLIACGGSKTNSATTGNTTGTGGPNTAPNAAFTVTGDAVALGTMLFDASSSSDPDGDTLRYDWKFGDDSRGGVLKLAHLFAAAGTFTVTLTVTDSHGASAKTTQDVTIGAGTTPSAAVPVLLTIKDTNGAAVVGADVTVEGSPSAAQSDTSGHATVSVGTNVEQTIRVLKPGFTRQLRVVHFPHDVPEATLDVVLTPRAAAQTLADIGAGGTITAAHGATLTLPPNGLINAAGATISGAVDVSVTPIDTRVAGAQFPGGFGARNQTGDSGVMFSYGVVEFDMSQNGEPLNLAPGVTATTEVPMFSKRLVDGTPIAVGDEIPLWSLDERTGTWIQEGVGLVVASTASPSGLAMRATLGHFSWFNCDAFGGGKRVDVKCRVVEVTATQEKIEAVEAGVCTIGANVNDSGAARAEGDPLPEFLVTTQMAFNSPVGLIMPLNVPLLVTSSTLANTWGSSAVVDVGADTESVELIVHQLVADDVDHGPHAVGVPSDQHWVIEQNAVEELYQITAPSAGGLVRIEVESSLAVALSGTAQVRRHGEANLCDAVFNNNTVQCLVDTTPDEVIELTLTASIGAPAELILRTSVVTATTETLPLDKPIAYTSQQTDETYAVVLGANDPIEVTVSGDNGGNASAYVVEASTGYSSASFMKLSAAQPGKFRFIAPRAGTYYFTTSHAATTGTLHADTFTPTIVSVGALPYFATGFTAASTTFFKVTATAGQHIGYYGKIPTGAGGPKLYAHAPLPQTPVPRISSTCPNSATTFVAPIAGDYYIEADPTGLGGTYNFTIAEVADFPFGSSTLGPDALQQAQAKFFKFNRGSETHARLGSFGLANCDYAPDGTKLPAAISADVYALPVPGTYVHLAVATTARAANAWADGVAALPTPVALGSGAASPVNAAITAVNQMYEATLDVTAGEYLSPGLVTDGLFAQGELRRPDTPFISGPLIALKSGFSNIPWCEDPILINTTETITLGLWSTRGAYVGLLGNVSGALNKHSAQTLGFDGSGHSPIETVNIPGTCDFKVWTFNLATPTVYRVRSHYVGPTVPTIPVGNVRLSNGTTLGFAFYGASVNPTADSYASANYLLTAGDHTLSIAGDKGHSMASGNNTEIDLIKIADPTVLTVDASATTGTISRAGQPIFYRFTLPAAGSFTIHTTTALAGRFYYYTDRTSWMTIPSASNDVLGNNLSASGASGSVWLIAVVPAETATGSFTVQVTQP